MSSLTTSPSRRPPAAAPRAPRRRPSNTAPMTPVMGPSAQPSSSSSPKLSHDQALETVRAFLNSQSSYDVFPVSFRLIVLDSMLVVKKAVAAMLQNSGSGLASYACPFADN